MFYILRLWFCKNNKILNEYFYLRKRQIDLYLWCKTHFVTVSGLDIALLSGFEVSVHAMSVCIWSPCARPVARSWLDEGCGALSLWCSLTAGMGWSLPTWQHAKRVSRSAPTVHLHLFTESTNKPCKRSRHACQWQHTVVVPEKAHLQETSKHYYCYYFCHTVSESPFVRISRTTNHFGSSFCCSSSIY